MGVIFLLWFIAVFVLLVMFTAIMIERKREFGLYRAFGATRKKLIGLILIESFLISLVGLACGILIGCLVVFSFKGLIAVEVGLPYLDPSVDVIVQYVLLSIGTAVITGPLASVLSVWKIAKSETYLIIREGI